MGLTALDHLLWLSSCCRGTTCRCHCASFCIPCTRRSPCLALALLPSLFGPAVLRDVRCRRRDSQPRHGDCHGHHDEARGHRVPGEWASASAPVCSGGERTSAPLCRGAQLLISTLAPMAIRGLLHRVIPVTASPVTGQLSGFAPALACAFPLLASPACRYPTWR